VEKALTHYGFDVRRVAAHVLEAPFPLGYVEPGLDSHAFTEVRTRKGWMVVDSVHAFVGVDSNGRVYDTADLRRSIGRDRGAAPKFDRRMHEIFRKDFTFLYGLYSRHGYFYSPRVPIPDVNWDWFISNFY
jgi:hypothetical protein